MALKNLTIIKSLSSTKPMTAIKQKLLDFIKSEWMIAFCLLAAFLITNGYTYGWDDQHLEIPLLKSLIDPGLYPGDFYIESLKQNFTSILYPMLARIISVGQVPITFFTLYIISRFFLFFWIYKLWLLISKRKSSAFFATLMIIVLGRVEEFLYRTFSHQEFALAIIFAGIYFFYKERFVLAAALLGIAANFHALYSLFPMTYLGVYLLVSYKKHGIRELGKTILAFAICALPLLVWVFQKYIGRAPTVDSALYNNWIALYQIACPQNFTFLEHSLQDMRTNHQVFLNASLRYWILIVFYLLNLVFNKTFRTDQKGHTMVLTGFLFLVISFVFSYITPNRFFLDLNLVRHSQYILFILMGYTTLLMIDNAEKSNWLIAIISVALFSLLRYGVYAGTLAGIALLIILSINFCVEKKRGWKRAASVILLILPLGLCVSATVLVFFTRRFNVFSLWSLLAIFLLLLVFYLLHFLPWLRQKKQLLRKLLIVIPLLIFTINYTYYHYHHLQIEKIGKGFWQMQRNWIDMQEYVRENTPKSALLLVPHDMEMGGFRIGSEREIICSYRDCGIIGFDYKAAVEWQNRLKDIESFQVFIKNPIAPALLNAILKYKVNYIVFMRYADPGENTMLSEVYKNDVFALYKVLPNPLPDAP